MNRPIQAGPAASFAPDNIAHFTNTTRRHGAEAAQDAYSLHRRAIRKVLRATAYSVAQQVRELAANPTPYPDSDRKASTGRADAVAHAAH